MLADRFADMGNGNVSKLTEANRVIRHPLNGVASDFYWACRNGDTELVKALRPGISYDQLNQLEPNGSTALHAASFYCHADVVRLLLHEYGVERHRVNRYGMTAYGEAQTEEIKKLFERPLNRFCNQQEEVQDTLEVLSVGGEILSNSDEDSSTEDNEVTNESEQRSTWIRVYRTKSEIDEEIYYYSRGRTLIQSNLSRFIMRHGQRFCPHCQQNKLATDEFIAYFNDRSFRVNKLRETIEQDVKKTHPEYEKCQRSLEEYAAHGDVCSLLHLYTIETPFYHNIRKCCQSVAWSLYITPSSFEGRFYRGLCYRGVSMTKPEVDEYQLASQSRDNLVKTKAFSSTSIERGVAEGFLDESPNEKLRVLMIFNFPFVSDMAINLGAIPEKGLPLISEYQNEREVLLLPQMFIRVQKVELNTEKNYYEIHLENIILKRISLVRALKFLVFRDEEPKLIAYYKKHMQ